MVYCQYFVVCVIFLASSFEPVAGKELNAFDEVKLATEAQYDGILNVLLAVLKSPSFSSGIDRISALQVYNEPQRNGTLRRIAANLFTKYQSIKTEGTLLSKECTAAMDSLATEIISKQDQSKIFQMLDADGKPGSGIAEGNIYWLGSYRECKENHFAHFCISQVKILSIPVTTGLCMPKECTNKDVFLILRTFANITNGLAPKPILQVSSDNSIAGSIGSPVHCQEPLKYSTGSIIAICVVALFAVLVLVGTSIDYLNTWAPAKVLLSKSNGFMPAKLSTDEVIEDMHVNESQPFFAQEDVKGSKGIFRDAFICFSFKKNAAQIFDTNIQSSAISSINGIRTLSMFWVILGHTFFFAMYAPSDNPKEGFKLIRRITFQAIANAYFSVDTFFLLSGLLVSYLTLKRFDRYSGNSFSGYFAKKFLPQAYFHRFLRLTPVYMFVILFYVFIFPFCGDGPLWFEKAEGKNIENCRKYWWTNLLYLNNFYPQEMGNECIGWSWYLANDMQFYLISPFIVIVMHKLGLRGAFIVNALICVASFIATGTIIGVNNLNALLTGDFQEASGHQAMEFANLIYSKPYSRIPPYIVGLSLGYFLYNAKKPFGLVKNVMTCIGWVLATGVALAATYGPYTYFKDGGRIPFTLTENILYGTFSRFSWAMAVAWVVYACHFGMGGIVNSLLSWKPFLPLSRLTYSAYLVHPIVIDVFYSSFETPLHFSDISIVYYYASFLLLTYASAFLLAVCVEFPLSNLEKLAFQF